MSSGVFVLGVLGLGLATGIPIAFLLIMGSFVGLIALRGFPVAMNALTSMPYAKVTDIGLAVVPLFVLMGYFAAQAGVSERAYQMAYRFVGHLRAGLAIATICACAAFAATSGSSVATSATVGKIAFREMKRFRYDDAVSAGTIASGGLLGLMIPPSIMLVIYGVVTQSNIGQLLIAGILPGILTAVVFALGLYVLALLRPELMPVAEERFSWRARLAGLRDGWGIGLLFLVVVGGIYGGLFTATEAAGIGALAALALLFLKRGADWAAVIEGGMDAARTCAMIFLILIGAGLFSQYVALSGLATGFARTVGETEMSRYAVLALILLCYLPLGMFLEPISMTLITLPIVFPVITHLGFDPIWFGVIIVKVSELANITPPLGINVYVIKGVNPDIPLSKVFSGAFLFMVLEVLILVVLILVPEIALLLPRLMLG